MPMMGRSAQHVVRAPNSYFEAAVPKGIIVMSWQLAVAE
jgi:hypothetical protein